MTRILNKRSRGGNFSCKHPKLYKWIKGNIISFFIGGAIAFTISVTATTFISSNQVEYKNDKSVETSINELYQKVPEVEMAKIGCKGCTKLGYLESTGTQYIDTGYQPNQDTRFDISFMTLNQLSSNAFGSIFGARTGSKSNELQILHLNI